MQLMLGPTPFTKFFIEAAAAKCADRYNELEKEAGGDWTYRVFDAGKHFLVAAHDEDGEFVSYMKRVA
jgi:hypothetical protein